MTRKIHFRRTPPIHHDLYWEAVRAAHEHFTINNKTMEITFLDYITFRIEITGINSETVSNILLEDFNRIAKIDAKIIEVLNCGEEVLLVTFSCKSSDFTEELRAKTVAYIKNRLAKTKQQIVADFLK